MRQLRWSPEGRHDRQNNMGEENTVFVMETDGLCLSSQFVRVRAGFQALHFVAGWVWRPRCLQW